LLLIERRFRSELCDGDLLWIYLILYPTGRFLLDFVRLDSNGFGPLTTAQLVSLLALLSAITILFIRHRQPALARPAIQARRRPESK
jgi:phosphatidylglycerol:prolipoprotein diacylglycerol transferase